MSSFLTLIPLSLGLSSDAFAASLARGGRAWKASLVPAMKSGAIFGSAEGLMCAGGWLAAFGFAEHIRALDHWIALILLVLIGGKMIREGLAAGEDDDENAPRSSGILGTVITALGTSIDSAAVGIALAFSGMPLYSALVVGGFSFTASTIGFLIGPLIGGWLGRYAEIGGGVILILIGIGIWVSHVFGGG